MSAGKILWGQIATVFLIVLTAIWIATQWIAWKLHYQPELGHPWFEIIQGAPGGGTPLTPMRLIFFYKAD